jgi:Asp/Glu/hydantoin racemase
VGYGESAVTVASLLGPRIGILAFIREMLPTLDRNVERMGMASRYVGAHYVGFGFNDVLAAYSGDPAPLLERFRTAARGLIARGADVLIPGEAPLCMLLNRAGIAEVDGVPLVDSLAATIKCGEMLVDLRRSTGVKRSKRGYFEAMPPRERLKELWKFYGLDRVSP